MTMKLSNGDLINWVGVDTAKTATCSSLKFAADIDYLAFISLWEIGLAISSTYVWTAAHCIEKYCKSLLLKNNSTVNITSYGHNIKKAWDDCKQFLTLGSDETLIDNFIEELNAVQPSVRYGQNSIVVSSGLPAILILTGAFLRKELVGNENYLKNFGLEPSLFRLRHGTNEISQDLKVMKILHLFFEHKITLSEMSIPDKLDFMGINIDTSSLCNGENLVTCPWCNGYRNIGQQATFELRKFLENKDK